MSGREVPPDNPPSSSAADDSESLRLFWRRLSQRLSRCWPAVLIGFVVFAAGALVQRMATTGQDKGHPLPYIAVAIFGMLVGATELVARYRDKPSAVLRTFPGFVYITVNAVVSLVVLWFLRTGQLGLTMTAVFAPTLNQVLLAGFGSMALFRTSIFTLRVRDTDIAIGPAAVLQVVLGAADRACDRLRAGPRAQRVQKIMRGVSFERAKKALPLHCVALMQNVSTDEQAQMNQIIAALSSEPMSPEIKSYNLGLVLMNLVGEDVLEEAVDGLGPLICGPTDDDPPILSNASRLKFEELRTLIEICLAIDPLARTGNAKAWLEVDATSVPRETDRNSIVLSRLRSYFGPDTVVKALALLAANKTPVEPVTGSLSLADLTPP
jgi:hypothetical protein